MQKIRLEIYPCVDNATIGEIEVSLEMSKEQYDKYLKMSKSAKIKYIKDNGTIKITDFDVDYSFDVDEDVSFDEV